MVYHYTPRSQQRRVELLIPNLKLGVSPSDDGTSSPRSNLHLRLRGYIKGSLVRFSFPRPGATRRIFPKVNSTRLCSFHTAPKNSPSALNNLVPVQMARPLGSCFLENRPGPGHSLDFLRLVCGFSHLAEPIGLISLQLYLCLVHQILYYNTRMTRPRSRTPARLVAATQTATVSGSTRLAPTIDRFKKAFAHSAPRRSIQV